MCVCFGCSWAPAAKSQPHPKTEGNHLSLGLPTRHSPLVSWPNRPSTLAARADNRKPRPGHGWGRAGSGPPPPLCSRAPRWPCRPGGWGWKREPVVPGPQRHASPALRPRKRKDTSRAAEETQEGSVPRASPWEPNRRRTLPERAISRPRSSRRLYAASAGPAGPLRLAAPGVSAGRPPPRGHPATPIPHPATSDSRPPPAPSRSPRTLASPPAAAEAAVGPIVVGIEVRHLPSPLREEPG